MQPFFAACQSLLARSSICPLHNAKLAQLDLHRFRHRLTSCRFDDCLFGYTIFISIDLDYQYQWPSFQSCIESQTCRFPGLPLLGRQDAVAWKQTSSFLTQSSRMPILLQLGNFWSPVAVASRHFHVCGSWRREMYWDVTMSYGWPVPIIADANWCQPCSAVIRPAEANCQDQRSGSRVMQRPRRLKWWYDMI